MRRTNNTWIILMRIFIIAVIFTGVIAAIESVLGPIYTLMYCFAAVFVAGCMLPIYQLNKKYTKTNHKTK